MASAYATVAAEGSYCAPVPVVSVIDGEQKSLPRADLQVQPGPRPRRRQRRDQGAVHGADRGHRRGQPAQGRPSGVRQDRHHRQQQAVVVRRLHPAAVHRRLGGHARRSRRRCATSPSPASSTRTSSVPPSRRRSGRTSWTRPPRGCPMRDFAEPSDKVLEGDRVRVPDVSGMSESDARKRAHRRRLHASRSDGERLLQPVAGRHRLHLPQRRAPRRCAASTSR